MWQEEGQRERERESQANSPLSVEPDTGLNPTTQAEIKSQMLNWLSHLGAPEFHFFPKILFIWEREREREQTQVEELDK